MISHSSYKLSTPRPGDTSSLCLGSGLSVRYLGSTTCSSKGHRLRSGISAFQKPLLDLYTAARRKHAVYPNVHELSLTQHIDLCEYGVVVAETEELENGEEMPIVTKVITPLSNIVMWAAVRFHTKMMNKKKIFGAAFVPIACSDGVLEKNSFIELSAKQRFLLGLTHPPLFTCVLQHVASPKTLECHSFACESSEDALNLCSALGELRQNCNRVGCLGLVPDDFIGYTYNRHFSRNGGSQVESSVISPSDMSSRYASSNPSDDTQTTQRIESYEERSSRCSPFPRSGGRASHRRLGSPREKVKCSPRVSGRRGSSRRTGTPREPTRQRGRGSRHSFKETATPRRTRYMEDMQSRKSSRHGTNTEVTSSMHSLSNSASDVGKKNDDRFPGRISLSPASLKSRYDVHREDSKPPEVPSPFRSNERKIPSSTIIQVQANTPKPVHPRRENMTICHTMDFSSESELESALSPSERRLALQLPVLRSRQQTIPEEQEFIGGSTSSINVTSAKYDSVIQSVRSYGNLNQKKRCGSVASMASSQHWVLTREMGTMTENDPHRITTLDDSEQLSTYSEKNSISSVDQLYAKPLKKSQRTGRDMAEYSETLDFGNESKSSSGTVAESQYANHATCQESYRYSDLALRRNFLMEHSAPFEAENVSPNKNGYRRSRSANDISSKYRRDYHQFPYQSATIDRGVCGRREEPMMPGGGMTCIKISVPYSKQRAPSDTSSYVAIGGAGQQIPQGIRSFHKQARVKNWSTLSQTSEMSFEGSATLPIAKTRQSHKAIRWSSAERLSRRPTFLMSIKKLSAKSFAQAKETTSKFFKTLKMKIKDHKKGSEISEDSAYDTSEVCLRPDGNLVLPKKTTRKTHRQMSWSFHDLRDSFPARVKSPVAVVRNTHSKEDMRVNHEKQPNFPIKTKQKTKKIKKRRRSKRLASSSMSSDSGVEEYHSDFSVPSHHKSESELEKFASEVTLVNVKHGMTERRFKRYSNTNLQNELGYIP